MPISRSGELSKERFFRRHRRANKVSLLTGILLVVAFAVLVFAALWNYFLKDLFSEAVRINIPNFVGSDYEDIINNREFQTLYNFTVVYTVDPQVDAGIIIDQTPASGRSVMKDSKGVEVELKVSTGIQMLKMPDVVNKEYRDAQVTLQKTGFVVEYELCYFHESGGRRQHPRRRYGLYDGLRRTGRGDGPDAQFGGPFQSGRDRAHRICKSLARHGDVRRQRDGGRHRRVANAKRVYDGQRAYESLSPGFKRTEADRTAGDGRAAGGDADTTHGDGNARNGP